MKKLYYLMSLVAIVAIGSTLFLTSCKKETVNDLLDLDTANITQMTESQRAIFDEAVKRIDPFVTFTDGQFVMSINNGEEVGVSNRLYNFLKEKMLLRNTFLTESYLKGQLPLEISRNSIRLVMKNDNFDFALTKSIGFEEGGVDQTIITRWYTYDCYISNSTLCRIAAWAGGGAAFAGLIPDPSISKVVAGILGVGAAGAAIASVEYPNGMIISFAGNPITGQGIPYYATAQTPNE